jgi:hypothetical protein
LATRYRTLFGGLAIRPHHRGVRMICSHALVRLITIL